jgi:hypothetical protein
LQFVSGAADDFIPFLLSPKGNMNQIALFR